ncbi:hypothetical protein STUTZSP0542_22170 [Stutzerimonas marianensis]
MGEREAQRDEEQQQPEDYQAQDLAERFHGRVLVFGVLKGSEYSAAAWPGGAVRVGVVGKAAVPAMRWRVGGGL